MQNWNDAKWLRLAQHYANEGSKDPSTKVGCVIVRPDRTPASWGVNGFPRGIADTPERLNDRPTKYDLTIHAELNALLFLREPAVGYSCYSTFAPCIRCAVNIIQKGIQRVIFYGSENERWAEEQARSICLFTEAGLETLAYDIEGKLLDHWHVSHMPPVAHPLFRDRVSISAGVGCSH